jgi:hypothetical protein
VKNMPVRLSCDEIEEARKKPCCGFCPSDDEQRTIHNHLAEVQVAFVLLFHDVVEEVAVISLRFHALEDLLSAIIEVLLSSLGDMGWNTPLQEALQWTSSGAYTPRGLFDSTSLD